MCYFARIWSNLAGCLQKAQTLYLLNNTQEAEGFDFCLGTSFQFVCFFFNRKLILSKMSTFTDDQIKHIRTILLYNQFYLILMKCLLSHKSK